MCNSGCLLWSGILSRKALEALSTEEFDCGLVYYLKVIILEGFFNRIRTLFFEINVFLKQLLLHILKKSISLVLKSCRFSLFTVRRFSLFTVHRFSLLVMWLCTHWDTEDSGHNCAESHKLQWAEHSLFAGQIGWTDWNDNKPKSSQDSREKKNNGAILGEIRNGKKMWYSNIVMQQGGIVVLFWKQAMRKFPVTRGISGVWWLFSTVFKIANQCKEAYLSFHFDKRWNKSQAKNKFCGNYY